MRQSECDPQQLQAFLDEQLSAEDEQQLIAHLSLCDTCGDQLEGHAAEQSVWHEAQDLLGSCDADLETSILADSQPPSPQIQHVLGWLSPSDDPQSLGRISTYEVTGVIGCGGMGVVLKAHDPSLDRVVAIKVLAPHLASSGPARQRFAREAKAAAAILHPNVIAIHSVSVDDSMPYLVMPYVRGESLQRRIDRNGPLPLSDILRIGVQVAAGLAAAHGQGLVHRDIKPANILLEDGVERVTITDFGLARTVDDASMTRSGVITGTPQYMSPEQVRGDAVDARSDLFSLGSVLYAMFSGHSPFRAETSWGVMHRVTSETPRSISQIRPEVPDWCVLLTDQLHVKDVKSRIDSAERVEQILRQCIAHLEQPSQTPLPAELEQPRTPLQRQWGLRSKRTIAWGVIPIALIAALVLMFKPLSDAPPSDSSESTQTQSDVASNSISSTEQRDETVETPIDFRWEQDALLSPAEIEQQSIELLQQTEDLFDPISPSTTYGARQ